MTDPAADRIKELEAEVSAWQASDKAAQAALDHSGKRIRQLEDELRYRKGKR